MDQKLRFESPTEIEARRDELHVPLLQDVLDNLQRRRIRVVVGTTNISSVSSPDNSCFVRQCYLLNVDFLVHTHTFIVKHCGIGKASK